MNTPIDKKKIVRQLIVMRKTMVAMNSITRAPYMKKYINAIAVDIGKIAEKHGLLYPLVTKKF